MTILQCVPKARWVGLICRTLGCACHSRITSVMELTNLADNESGDDNTEKYKNSTHTHTK